MTSYLRPFAQILHHHPDRHSKAWTVGTPTACLTGSPSPSSSKPQARVDRRNSMPPSSSAKYVAPATATTTATTALASSSKYLVAPLTITLRKVASLSRRNRMTQPPDTRLIEISVATSAGSEPSSIPDAAAAVATTTTTTATTTTSVSDKDKGRSRNYSTAIGRVLDTFQMAYPRRRRRRSLSVGTTHHEHNSDNDKNEATAASARSLSPKRTRKAVSFSEEQPMVLETYSNDDYNRQIGEDPWYEMTPQERDEVRQQIWDYIHLEMPLNECYTSGRHKYCQLCWRNTCTCRIRAREMWRRRPGISASFVSCKYRPRPVSASSPRRRSPSFTLRRVDSSFG